MFVSYLSLQQLKIICFFYLSQQLFLKKIDDYAKEVSSLPHMIEFIQQNLHKDIRCLPAYVNLSFVLLNANCILKIFFSLKLFFSNSFLNTKS